MTVKQLSIFLENRSGTLTKVLDILKESGIQIIASSIADTAEYGILRILSSDPSLAYKKLEEGGVAVALSEVFAIELDNRPGCGADAIKVFSDAGISIAYLYSFLVAGKGILVFRTDNNEQAREAIVLNNLKFVTEKMLEEWELSPFLVSKQPALFFYLEFINHRGVLSSRSPGVTCLAIWITILCKVRPSINNFI